MGGVASQGQPGADVPGAPRNLPRTISRDAKSNLLQGGLVEKSAMTETPNIKQPRPRDPIWDALTDAFGEVRTESERGRRNRAVRELRAAEVTPEEVSIVADFCRRNFTQYTEMAVCNWLSQALREAQGTADVRALFRRLEGGKG